ncbi:hypothetical protein X975_16635, partial [Stegodyphus mimosarum]
MLNHFVERFILMNYGCIRIQELKVTFLLAFYGLSYASFHFLSPS